MSNKSYDADYIPNESEQDPNSVRKQGESFPTRSERHRSAQQELADKLEEKSSWDVEKGQLPGWLRVILWILRKSIAPIIMIVMLLAGLYIGYVIVGDQPKEEVFEFSTWKHMWDLIFAES